MEDNAEDDDGEDGGDGHPGGNKPPGAEQDRKVQPTSQTDAVPVVADDDQDE